MSAARAPLLSVVVPSVTGWDDLRGALDALALAARAVPLEVLVPERLGGGIRVELALRYPAARVLPVAADTSIPRMRALAFAAATAPTVAVIEDHVLVGLGWAERIVALRKAGHRVIGGGVENAATERTVDWAAFLCEYHSVLAERPNGPASWLAGNNVAYDRALLTELAGVIAEGRWEDRLHDALRAHGVELWYDAELGVGHRRRYRAAGAYAAERYTYSRAWAAMRVADAGGGAAARTLGALRALLLPPVLFARIVARAMPRRGLRGPLFRSLPYLSGFVIAWACGEAVGALAGDGGALARVR